MVRVFADREIGLFGRLQYIQQKVCRTQFTAILNKKIAFIQALSTRVYR